MLNLKEMLALCCWRCSNDTEDENVPVLTVKVLERRGRKAAIMILDEAGANARDAAGNMSATRKAANEAIQRKGSLMEEARRL